MGSNPSQQRNHEEDNHINLNPPSRRNRLTLPTTKRPLQHGDPPTIHRRGLSHNPLPNPRLLSLPRQETSPGSKRDALSRATHRHPYPARPTPRHQRRKPSLGPFIIMEYIDHNADLVDVLNTPGIPDEERPVLDPNIDENRLRSVYNQIAGLLLQVAKHSLPRIGCISNAAEDEFEGDWVVFLQELRMREDVDIRRGVIKEGNRLSQHMRESWNNGGFWVTYAARRSWAFDVIYWARIDRRFFGEGTLEDRIELLTVEERNAMEDFVQRKLAEEERGLI